MLNLMNRPYPKVIVLTLLFFHDPTPASPAISTSIQSVPSVSFLRLMAYRRQSEQISRC